MKLALSSTSLVLCRLIY
uniref:Uncharacterized protein n=1 Tax=Arundo donax TaxID=35708 RepID=A0A0A8ZBG6_ARUDO